MRRPVGEAGDLAGVVLHGAGVLRARGGADLHPGLALRGPGRRGAGARELSRRRHRARADPPAARCETDGSAPSPTPAGTAARGSSTGHGRCRTIVCPYHSWTYGPDGRLLGAPGMQDRPGFDRTDWGLTRVRCESWQGFVFVSLAESGPGLVEHLGDLAEKLGSYDFDQMVCVRRIDYELAANWKLIVENAMEEYHTGAVHHASLGQQYAVQEETRGPLGRDLASPAGDEHRGPARRNGAVSHVPGLRGRPAHGPTSRSSTRRRSSPATQDAMWWLRVLPLGPVRSRLEVGFCFPRATVARTDFTEECEEVHAPVGDRHRGGQWDLRGAAGRAGVRAETTRPVRAPRGGASTAVNNWVMDQVLDGPGRRRSVLEP